VNTLAQEYKDGGQKMLHFDTFCKTAILVWIKKLYVTDENHSWKTVALRILMEKNISCIFEGSIQNIKFNANTTNNRFWKEVLQSWAFYRENIEKEDQHEIIPHMVIWSSGLIRNSNLINRKNYFMSKGLLYLKDLYNYDTKCFRNRQDIQEAYNVNMTYFDHLCLIQSVPKQIKNIITLRHTQTIIGKYGKIVLDICERKKPCRYAYTKIIINLKFNISAKPKWEYSIMQQIQESDWHNIFTLPSKITPDAQLRIFQYKILHRTLPSNKLLHIYRIRTDPWCDKCVNTIETLEHVFHMCPVILRLWYDVADWLFPELDLYQYINTEYILLGIYKEKKNLENIILLLVKRYIYNNKCHNEELTTNGLKRYLKQTAHLECNSISTKRKLQNNLKWEPIREKINMT
jgi:hypothetical protein